MDRAVTRGLAARAAGWLRCMSGSMRRRQERARTTSPWSATWIAARVDYVADERRQASLDGYFEKFTTEQLAGIKAVAMDMWEPFAASVREHLTDPDDKIVFDRYHLMGYLTTAVDTVRKQENKALIVAGDKSLAGSKYLWLTRTENLPARHQDRFATLRAGDLRTARAWAIKESLRHFWSYKRRGWAVKHFNTLVLLGHPLPAQTDHRRGEDPQTSSNRGCCPTSTPGSPTPAPKASTPASKRSESPRVATATASTSRPRSTSTSAAYSSTRPPRDPRTSRKSPKRRASVPIGDTRRSLTRRERRGSASYAGLPR